VVLDHSAARAAQAAWSTEGFASAPAAPSLKGRIDWDPSPGAGCITLPPLGLSMRRVFWLVLGICATLVGVAITLGQLGLHVVPIGIAGAGPVLTVLLLIFGTVTSALMLGLTRSRQVIREDLGNLLIYRTTLLGGRRDERSLVRREIEEIGVAEVANDYRRRLRAGLGLDPEEVALRTRARTVRVGETLTGEEQRWLVQALKYLAAR
jgi:hypothetical protein